MVVKELNNINLRYGVKGRRQAVLSLNFFMLDAMIVGGTPWGKMIKLALL